MGALSYTTPEELRTIILDYEVSSSWWAGWIGGELAQAVSAKYFAWKVKRKFASYMKSVDYRKKHGIVREL
jgi:hypothetical protein